jgi:hypothetical protein
MREHRRCHSPLCHGIVNGKHVPVAGFATRSERLYLQQPGNEPKMLVFCSVFIRDFSANTSGDRRFFLGSSRFSTTRPHSPQDVHREEPVSGCGTGGFGCRVEIHRFFR